MASRDFSFSSMVRGFPLGSLDCVGDGAMSTQAYQLFDEQGGKACDSALPVQVVTEEVVFFQLFALERAGKRARLPLFKTVKESRLADLPPYMRRELRSEQPLFSAWEAGRILTEQPVVEARIGLGPLLADRRVRIEDQDLELDLRPEQLRRLLAAGRARLWAGAGDNRREIMVIIDDLEARVAQDFRRNRCKNRLGTARDAG
jgi:hypothetical protein